MALGVVARRLPGRVERDGVCCRCRAHGRAVPDAARARVLVALLRAHGTLTMRHPSALAAAAAARGRLPRRRWRGRGSLQCGKLQNWRLRPSLAATPTGPTAPGESSRRRPG